MWATERFSPAPNVSSCVRSPIALETPSPSTILSEQELSDIFTGKRPVTPDTIAWVTIQAQRCFPRNIAINPPDPKDTIIRRIVVGTGTWDGPSTQNLIALIRLIERYMQPTHITMEREVIFHPKASFAYLFMPDITFDNVVLPSANFTGSNLMGTSFVGAKLPESDFTGANLWHADFSGADLWDAYILWKDNRRILLTPEYLSAQGAIFNKKTIFSIKKQVP